MQRTVRSLALLAAVAAAALAGLAPAARARPPLVHAAAATPGGCIFLTTGGRIAAASAWAATRPGLVSFAVLDECGRLRGKAVSRTYPSASVVKAMLLVALARTTRHRDLTARERALLVPMITRSDNAAAHAVFARVGRSGLRDVAQAARMRHFATDPHLFDTQISAGDQARLFFAIDTLLPARDRAFGVALLHSIVPEQRWGIAPVAALTGTDIFFKGGWRRGLTHQAALLERGGHRIALAVLTSRQPSMLTGEATIQGIAARILGG